MRLGLSRAVILSPQAKNPVIAVVMPRDSSLRSASLYSVQNDSEPNTMIAYIQGKIQDKQENFVVIDISGIGYKVFCSSNVLDKISQGQEIKLLTHFYLKEGIMDLYGFLNSDDLKLFRTLLGISGIGPKAGLAIVSLGSREQIEKAVEKNDMEFFDKVKGIGRKKIQKIILELTGKLKEIKKTAPVHAQTDEALSALVSLGFAHQDAKSALSEIPDEVQDTDKRVEQAIKLLGNRG